MKAYVEDFKNDFSAGVENRAVRALDNAEINTGQRTFQPHRTRGHIVLQQVAAIVPEVLGGVRDDLQFKVVGIRTDGVTTHQDYVDVMLLGKKLSDDFTEAVENENSKQPSKRTALVIAEIKESATQLTEAAANIADIDAKKSCWGAIEILDFIVEYMEKETFTDEIASPYNWW